MLELIKTKILKKYTDYKHNTVNNNFLWMKIKRVNNSVARGLWSQLPSTTFSKLYNKIKIIKIKYQFSFSFYKNNPYVKIYIISNFTILLS